MINPKLLCKQHLLGEHFEIHKLIGNLKHTGKWARALTRKGFLEPQNALKRHNKLAAEIVKRNMKHKSPLKLEGVDLPHGTVNLKKSIKDLTKRCRKCRERIKKNVSK